jgi:hypothetical protein
MTQRLIPPSYLFTFSLPIYYRAKLWAKNLELEPSYRIPSFVLLDRPTLGQSKLHAPAGKPVGESVPGESSEDADEVVAATAELAAAAGGGTGAKKKTSKRTKGATEQTAADTASGAKPGAQPGATAEAANAEAADATVGPLDTRIAWSEEGITFQFVLRGKLRRPYCRLSDLEHSDGIEIYVDTRNTKNVHRATRYCHRFVFLPGGGGPGEKDPYGSMLKINMARGEPATMGAYQPHVECKLSSTGYRLTCHLSRQYLEGWSPSEQPEVGLFFHLRDAELGHICLAYDKQLPIGEDPSLWPTAFLARMPG